MAGDIREIDMTKATSLDGKKVRLVGDDGKGYWMDKDTFISVVGGLINSQKLYPYMYKGTAGDLDALKDESGFWTVVNGKTTNLPNNTYPYGIIEVVKAEPYVIQRYFPISAGSYSRFGMLTRFYSESGWIGWYYIPYQI